MITRQSPTSALRILHISPASGVNPWLGCLCALALVCAPAQAHLISSPSIVKPAIEAPVELGWPTESDDRPARLDESYFSTALAMARYRETLRPSFDVRQLDESASSQPFFVGAPFGEGGLLGFRFNDFGPYGQEFSRSALKEDEYDGFVPFQDQFAGLGPSNRFGGLGSANSESSAANGAAARDATGSSGENGVNLMQGAYNPFNYQNFFRTTSSGGGNADGSSSDESAWFTDAALLAGESQGTDWTLWGQRRWENRGLFDRGGILADFGPLDPLGWPYGGFGFGRGPGLIPYLALYACGDFDRPTPILGWPFGFLNPIIGPIGPIGFPFPLLHHWCCHHHCCPHCHPPCVPEPSHLAMLLTMGPFLGLVYRARSARRRQQRVPANLKRA